VFVYARTHTQTTWVLDVSPGMGQTPGDPVESRSAKAQYACRPYRCTQYICLYMYCTAGFTPESLSLRDVSIQKLVSRISQLSRRENGSIFQNINF